MPHLRLINHLKTIDMYKRFFKFIIKPLLVILGLIIVIPIVLSLTFLRPSDHYRTANDPEKIAKYAGWNIPDFEVSNTGGNKCNTGSSQWCDYNYNIDFIDDFTKNDVNKLKELTRKDKRWTYHKNDNVYEFQYDMNNSYLLGYSEWNEDENISVSIKVYIDKKRAYLSYSWNETETYVRWNKDKLMFDLVLM